MVNDYQAARSVDSHIPLVPRSLSGIQQGYDAAELIQYNVAYIPSFLIKKAIEFGFIIPGWDLTDYILAAIKGNPNESIKRLGFVSVGMWGELGCLTSDMRVLTPVGLVKISNLKVGDEVISFSGEGLCSSLVTKTWVHVAPVYCVETGRRRIYSTLEHRFLTQRGWVEAQYLNRGDKLLFVDTDDYINLVDERGQGTPQSDVLRPAFECIPNCRRTWADGQISHSYESALRHKGHDVVISSRPSSPSNLEPFPYTTRTGILGWHYRRRRNAYNHHYDPFRWSFSTPSINNHKQLSGVIRLDRGINACNGETRFTQVQRQFDASFNSRATVGEHSPSSPSLFNSKEETCRAYYRVLRRSNGAAYRNTLYPSVSRDFLDNSSYESFNCQEGEEVRGVSRFCSEERVYDITTSLGNYVAEDLVVHNSGKTNLSMQIAFAVHHDWDIVLDRIILMREDLVKTYRAVMNVDYRIPIAIIDDVTTLLPRSLWQQDRELYTVFNKFLAVIRPKIACMISTVPDISWMLETMTEVMNFEVCVTPNQRFLVQRFYKETDPQKQASVNFMKILVEYADFDLENVPGDVWAEYQDRRQRLVDEVVKQLEKKLGSPKTAERVEIGSSGILAEPLGDKGIKYILGDDADRYAIKCVKCGHITSVEKDRKNKYVRCWGCKTVIDCRFGA